MEIFTLPAEELAAMKEACEPIYDEFRGYGLSDLLDTIESYST